mgnify:CR=1 FL=1
MTPAEKPRDTLRKRVLVCLVKKAIADPTPVARPANRVRAKAKRMTDVSNMAKCIAALLADQKIALYRKIRLYFYESKGVMSINGTPYIYFICTM